MKRKRLNHFADAVIGILTGYQAITNFDYFKKYGEGEYVLDLLKGHLTFNGADAELFPIFSNIQSWFNSEITTNRIDKDFINVAKVILKVGPISVQQIRTEVRNWLFFKRILQNDIYDCKTDINLILGRLEGMLLISQLRLC
jgi:hypothetical protein